MLLRPLLVRYRLRLLVSASTSIGDSFTVRVMFFRAVPLRKEMVFCPVMSIR